METPRPEFLGTRYERLFAFVLDAIFVAAVAGFVAAILGLSLVVGMAIAAVVGALYAPIVMSRPGERNGQTVGKQAVGLRVLRDEGTPVDFRTGLIRDGLLKYVVGAATVGLFLIASGLASLGRDDRRALHDRVAGTLVARSSERWVSAPSEVIPAPKASPGELPEYSVRA